MARAMLKAKRKFQRLRLGELPVPKEDGFQLRE